MLSDMRKQTKLVLWFVVVAFVATILFSWGMNITSKRKAPKHLLYAGKVDGIPITRDQVYKGIQNLYMQHQQRTGQTPDDRVVNQFYQQAWRTLIEETLMRNEIARADISVTDEEIYNYIKNNPPEIVRSQEVFQTDGAFDRNKYLTALANPEGNLQFWTFLEDYIRSSLPMELLQSQISLAARITDIEVKHEFLSLNEKVKLDYFTISPYSIAREGIEATEDEVRAYWEAHPDDFHQEKQAVVEFVEFPLIPSEEDVEATRERLVDIRERITDGEGFAEIARVYSEDDTSREKGGDLDWIPEHHLTPELSEAVAKLKVGEISEPVKDRMGWHLIKLEEKRKEKGKPQHHLSRILLEIIPSHETTSAAEDRAAAFLDNLETMNFDEAAASDSLEIGESQPFSDPWDLGVEDPFQAQFRSFIPGIGLLPDGVEFAFRSEPGRTSDLIRSEEALYVFRLKEIIPAHVIPFEESMRRAERMVQLEKQKAKTREIALEGEKLLVEGKSLKQIADALDMEVKETELVSRKDYIQGVGRDTAFLARAFTGEVGSTTGPVSLKDKDAYAFLRILDHKTPSEEEFEQKKDSLLEEMLGKRQQDIFNYWFTALRESAEIEDLRFVEQEEAGKDRKEKKRQAPQSQMPF